MVLSLEKIRWMKEHWKLGIHLWFGTKRFGVNNQRWCTFNSILAKPWRKRWRLFYNYKFMKARARASCALPSDTMKMLGWDE